MAHRAILLLSLVALPHVACHDPSASKAPASTLRTDAGTDSRKALEIFKKLDSAPEARIGRLTARVRDVVDGDTIVLSDGEKVRYLAIDTPERETPRYRAATTLNRRLVDRRRVTLVFPRESPRDNFGRLLAAVFVELDSGIVLVNAELVRAGLARTYFKADDPVSQSLAPFLIAEQQRAMEERLGIWAASEGDAKRRVLITKNRFHRPDCRHIRGRDGPFRTREEALRSGRSPCRSCRP